MAICSSPTLAGSFLLRELKHTLMKLILVSLYSCSDVLSFIRVLADVTSWVPNWCSVSFFTIRYSTETHVSDFYSLDNNGLYTPLYNSLHTYAVIVWLERESYPKIRVSSGIGCNILHILAAISFKPFQLSRGTMQIHICVDPIFSCIVLNSFAIKYYTN